MTSKNYIEHRHVKFLPLSIDTLSQIDIFLHHRDTLLGWIVQRLAASMSCTKMSSS